ncbi:MAG: cryptochrome/photolyase family protein [Bryobacteraceae bacterium]|nr:cryptochrome/photolyase family protein [Bryobacteraceae bacterium]
MPCRDLCVILGDQLCRRSPVLERARRGEDVVWMAEAAEESTHVPSHKARTALFLAAMRHHAAWLAAQGWRVDYRRLDDPGNTGSLGGELLAAIRRHHPRRVVLLEAGEWRVAKMFEDVCGAEGVPLVWLSDPHFYATRDDFRQHARGRKQLRMEFFYREMRRRHGILMEKHGPAGGKWNFDAENRESFSSSGPGGIPQPAGFPPDDITREVLRLVEQRFPDNPGSLRHFDWPVTPEQARAALDDFIGNRLPQFGRFQDAMWTEQPFLFHSRLSAAMNLKLLEARDAVRAAEEAWREGKAPLASVEGFIRQILGWREYVRGVYWLWMPEYATWNALDAQAPLPRFYWTGETEMRCLREVIGQTLEYGYAHHIQRLMVAGLFALLAGVEPRQVHEWYLGIYVDAVEWVELPNVLGMSQFADGGRMASKPYAATGKYIARMSNYCQGCRYDPARATGENACPFTVLYWDFLMRNEGELRRVPRMEMQLANLRRLAPDARREIRAQAGRVKKEVCV